MLTSKPPLPEKSLMLMPPGREDTMPKRDSHSIPQGRPGPPTCQTMLLRTQISMSKPQLQLRKLLLMPPRPKPPLKQKPTHQRRRRKPPPLPRKPPLPNQLPPHHSFNSTEAETLLKRELDNNLNLNHLDLNQLAAPAAANQPQTQTEVEKKEKISFSDREFVFKEFK